MDYATELISFGMQSGNSKVTESAMHICNEIQSMKFSRNRQVKITDFFQKK